MKISTFCLLLVLIQSLISDTFKLTENNEDNTQVSIGQNLIIGLGIGSTQKEALNKAFTSAIESLVGIVVESESIIQDNVLIKDEILTASGGYIESYKILEEREEDDLFIVKIEADVKTQNLCEKIKALHIDTKELTSQEVQNIYSRIKTKAKMKDEAGKILKKLVDKFTNPETISKMLEVKIINVKFDENNVVNGMVPMTIRYQLSYNYKVYLQEIIYIEEILKDLNIEKKENIERIKYSNKGNLKYDYFSKRSIPMTTLGFAKFKDLSVGDKILVDAYFFPESWNDIYPLKITNESIKIWDNANLKLTLKDQDNNIITNDSELFNKTKEINDTLLNKIIGLKNIIANDEKYYREKKYYEECNLKLKSYEDEYEKFCFSVRKFYSNTYNLNLDKYNPENNTNYYPSLFKNNFNLCLLTSIIYGGTTDIVYSDGFCTYQGSYKKDSLLRIYGPFFDSVTREDNICENKLEISKICDTLDFLIPLEYISKISEIILEIKPIDRKIIE